MTEAGFLDRARQLEPLVTNLRDSFDRERRLPLELVEAIRAAGLLRMWLPRAVGGAELAPLHFLDVAEELARQDGSVGWCTTIAAGSARLAGAMDEEGMRAVFGTGDGVLVGTLAPAGEAIAVPGGYQVTGRWSYGSFIDHADWVLGGCRTDDGGERLCLFPRTDAEVLDVWHVSGLRGTASNDYRVSDLFVPDRLTIPIIDFQPPPRHDGPLYAVPMTSLFASCIAMVAVGIARAALDHLVQIGSTKRIAGSPVLLRENPLAQIDLARGEAKLESGRAYLRRELGRMWEDTVAGRPMTDTALGRAKLAACHATTCAIEAVDLAFQSAGGAALREGSGLERCFRDVHAVGQHARLTRHGTLEPVGKVLFGLSPDGVRL
jgi:alkylation response protein AidB-like acyl-CoA dehydrogenase